MEAKRNLISSLERRILFYMVAFGLHACPSFCNQYMTISWWDVTVENVRVTCSTQIRCDIMLSYVMQKVLLLLRKIRDLNVNLENNWDDNVSTASYRTEWRNGNICILCFGRCLFRILGWDTSCHNYFRGFSHSFRKYLGCNLYETTTAFIPFSHYLSVILRTFP